MSPENDCSRDHHDGADWHAAERALRAADAASGGEAEAEVVLRRARGGSVRRARATPPEHGTWHESAHAVRMVLGDGRSGLAARAGWHGFEESAAEALELAESARVPPGAPAGLGRARARAAVRGGVATGPATGDDMLAAIACVESAALGWDPRVVALDSATARVAIVESYLASTAGAAVHQLQASALVHAAVIARDGLRVTGHGAAWAGARLDEAEMRRFGERLGRTAVVHLVGSGAAPPLLRRVLLAPQALAEITFALAPALLGLSASRPEAASSLPAPAELSLVEDAVDDGAARALAADGDGRPLDRVDVVARGRWARPDAARLPRVRAGLSDLPRPGWMRLTWSWEGGLDDAELVARLGTGLLVESAHALEVDARSLSWRGAVSGTWVEDGRRRHAVAGQPFDLRLDELLAAAAAGGREPLSAHASGTIRAVALLLDLERTRR